LIKNKFPYKIKNMEETRKTSDPALGLEDIGNDARRQYIDARSVFTAWEDAVRNAAEVRGGMYWKRQGSTEYLIRTSTKNSQKSLGPRSPESEKIYEKFIARKAEAESRVSDLEVELTRQQRMNRALYVGRTPQLLVDILAQFARSGLSGHFTVVGTQALYAYEAAAGVRFTSSSAMATRDFDFLWDTRKRLAFAAQMKVLDTSMLGLLKKIDSTFELREDQRHTAVNSKGFEVDIIRPSHVEGESRATLMSQDEGDFWAIFARRAEILLNAPVFDSMVVSPSGHMARMRAVSPVTFIGFKRWMAVQQDRDPLKAPKDSLQADLVERMVEEYLPHLISDSKK
jgi:hypothetical protein